jgi:hypothetical protein
MVECVNVTMVVQIVEKVVSREEDHTTHYTLRESNNWHRS